MDVPVPPALARRLVDGEETYAVTGATGWFGRVTLDLLGRTLGPDAFARRVTSYASRSRTVDVLGVGPVEVRPLDELEPAEVLLHYAFLTRRALDPRELDAFVRTNIEVTTRVLAAVSSGDVRRLFLTSSGAARSLDLRVSPYGALKAIDELAFPEACRRVDAACVVARVYNVAGAHMTHPEVYALGDLIRRARAGEQLVLSATGDVVRSFVGVEEVVLVALGELLDGRSAAFETAGDEAVEIEQLARTVLRVLEREDLPVVRHREEGAAANVYVGDGSRLRQLAARHSVKLRPLDALVAAASA